MRAEIVRSLIFGISLAMFVAGLDTSIINVMLPKLHDLFGSSMPKTMLISSVYFTLMAVFMLPFGRVADLTNPIRVFLGGVVTFFAGSFFCGLAPGMSSLIAGRAVQGLGASMLAASFGAIVLHYFPRNKRGSVLGTIMMGLNIGAIVGSPLGGLLVGHFSWRWAFWVNLPIMGLAAILLSGKNGFGAGIESQTTGRAAGSQVFRKPVMLMISIRLIAIMSIPAE